MQRLFRIGESLEIFQLFFVITLIESNRFAHYIIEVVAVDLNFPGWNSTTGAATPVFYFRYNSCCVQAGTESSNQGARVTHNTVVYRQ